MPRVKCERVESPIGKMRICELHQFTVTLRAFLTIILLLIVHRFVLVYITTAIILPLDDVSTFIQVAAESSIWWSPWIVPEVSAKTGSTQSNVWSSTRYSSWTCGLTALGSDSSTGATPVHWRFPCSATTRRSKTWSRRSLECLSSATRHTRPMDFACYERLAIQRHCSVSNGASSCNINETCERIDNIHAERRLNDTYSRIGKRSKSIQSLLDVLQV